MIDQSLSPYGYRIVTAKVNQLVVKSSDSDQFDIVRYKQRLIFNINNIIVSLTEVTEQIRDSGITIKYEVEATTIDDLVELDNVAKYLFKLIHQTTNIYSLRQLSQVKSTQINNDYDHILFDKSGMWIISKNNYNLLFLSEIDLDFFDQSIGTLISGKYKDNCFTITDCLIFRTIRVSNRKDLAVSLLKQLKCDIFEIE